MLDILSSTRPPGRAFITQLINSLSFLSPGLNSANATDHNATATSLNNPLNSVPESAKKQMLTLHVLFPNELLPALDLLDRKLVTRFRIRSKETDENGDVAQAGEAEALEDTKGELEGVIMGSGEASAKDSDAMDKSGNNEQLNISNVQNKHGIPSDQPTPPTPPSNIVTSLLNAPDSSPSQTIYYVRSAQQRTSRFKESYESTTYYEVRLSAWTCSCPAFAFAAFPSTNFLEPFFPQQQQDDAASRNRNSISVQLEDAGLPAGAEDDGKNGDDWLFGGLTLGHTTPPVCKHLLACVLVDRCPLFEGFSEKRDVSVEEAAGWAAGWGD